MFFAWTSALIPQIDYEVAKNGRRCDDWQKSRAVAELIDLASALFGRSAIGMSEAPLRSMTPQALDEQRSFDGSRVCQVLSAFRMHIRCVAAHGLVARPGGAGMPSESVLRAGRNPGGHARRARRAASSLGLACGRPDVRRKSRTRSTSCGGGRAVPGWARRDSRCWWCARRPGRESVDPLGSSVIALATLSRVARPRAGRLRWRPG